MIASEAKRQQKRRAELGPRRLTLRRKRVSKRLTYGAQIMPSASLEAAMRRAWQVRAKEPWFNWKALGTLSFASCSHIVPDNHGLFCIYTGRSLPRLPSRGAPPKLPDVLGAGPLQPSLRQRTLISALSIFKKGKAGATCHTGAAWQSADAAAAAPAGPEIAGTGAATTRRQQGGGMGRGVADAHAGAGAGTGAAVTAGMAGGYLTGTTLPVRLAVAAGAAGSRSGAAAQPSAAAAAQPPPAAAAAQPLPVRRQQPQPPQLPPQQPAGRGKLDADSDPDGNGSQPPEAPPELQPQQATAAAAAAATAAAAAAACFAAGPDFGTSRPGAIPGSGLLAASGAAGGGGSGGGGGGAGGGPAPTNARSPAGSSRPDPLRALTAQLRRRVADMVAEDVGVSLQHPQHQKQQQQPEQGQQQPSQQQPAAPLPEQQSPTQAPLPSSHDCGRAPAPAPADGPGQAGTGRADRRAGPAAAAAAQTAAAASEAGSQLLSGSAMAAVSTTTGSAGLARSVSTSHELSGLTAVAAGAARGGGGGGGGGLGWGEGGGGGGGYVGRAIGAGGKATSRQQPARGQRRSSLHVPPAAPQPQLQPPRTFAAPVLSASVSLGSGGYSRDAAQPQPSAGTGRHWQLAAAAAVAVSEEQQHDGGGVGKADEGLCDVDFELGAGMHAVSAEDLAFPATRRQHHHVHHVRGRGLQSACEDPDADQEPQQQRRLPLASPLDDGGLWHEPAGDDDDGAGGGGGGAGAGALGDGGSSDGEAERALFASCSGRKRRRTSLGSGSAFAGHRVEALGMERTSDVGSDEDQDWLAQRACRHRPGTHQHQHQQKQSQQLLGTAVGWAAHDEMEAAEALELRLFADSSAAREGTRLLAGSRLAGCGSDADDPGSDDDDGGGGDDDLQALLGRPSQNTAGRPGGLDGGGLDGLDGLDGGASGGGGGRAAQWRQGWLTRQAGGGGGGGGVQGPQLGDEDGDGVGDGELDTLFGTWAEHS